MVCIIKKITGGLGNNFNTRHNKGMVAKLELKTVSLPVLEGFNAYYNLHDYIIWDMIIPIGKFRSRGILRDDISR